MREKYRNVIREEDAKLYNKVDGIFINGQKNATLSIVKRTIGKYYSTDSQFLNSTMR